MKCRYKNFHLGAKYVYLTKGPEGPKGEDEDPIKTREAASAVEDIQAQPLEAADLIIELETSAEQATTKAKENIGTFQDAGNKKVDYQEPYVGRINDAAIEATETINSNMSNYKKMEILVKGITDAEITLDEGLNHFNADLSKEGDIEAIDGLSRLINEHSDMGDEISRMEAAPGLEGKKDAILTQIDQQIDIFKAQRNAIVASVRENMSSVDDLVQSLDGIIEAENVVLEDIEHVQQKMLELSYVLEILKESAMEGDFSDIETKKASLEATVNRAYELYLTQHSELKDAWEKSQASLDKLRLSKLQLVSLGPNENKSAIAAAKRAVEDSQDSYLAAHTQFLTLAEDFEGAEEVHVPDIYTLAHFPITTEEEGESPKEPPRQRVASRGKSIPKTPAQAPETAPAEQPTPEEETTTVEANGTEKPQQEEQKPSVEANGKGQSPEQELQEEAAAEGTNESAKVASAETFDIERDNPYGESEEAPSDEPPTGPNEAVA